MPTALRRTQDARILRRLLLLAALVLILSAAAYNELLLTALDPTPPLAPDTLHAVRRTQLVLLVAGSLAAAASLAIARQPALARRASGPWPVRLTLVALVLLPIGIVELALRPATPLGRPMTTIFVRDDLLGWRLRPGARGQWGGVDVEINADGLRGPRVSRDKPEGERRLLFLGDSVTFGYRVGEPPFPPRVAEALERELSAPVVAINGGVGGYSPWQERIWLEREGLAYDPDVVVLDFVLNDVTEKFGLVRFGGSGEGFQLEHTAFGLVDELANRSALVYQIRAVMRRRRYGPDLQAGAERRELLEVRNLAKEAPSAGVEHAWEVTLGNVRGIVDACAEHDLPLLIAVFPYAFQFEDPERLSAPQRRMSAFASEEGVPLVDLLPRLAERLADAGRGPEAYFIDASHLTAEGAAVVAVILADELLSRGWLSETSHR